MVHSLCLNPENCPICSQMGKMENNLPHINCSGPCCLPPETAAWKYGKRISLQLGDPQGSIGSGSISTTTQVNIQCPADGSWHVAGCSCPKAQFSLQGWTCPVCFGGVSPYATRCPCKPLPNQLYPFGGGISQPYPIIGGVGGEVAPLTVGQSGVIPLTMDTSTPVVVTPADSK